MASTVSNTPVSVNAMPTTNLYNLPRELLFIIAKELPVDSVACLALCNKPLCASLSYDYWGDLRTGNRDVRFRFILSLSTDLPEYFICHKCIRLHPRISVLLPAPQTRKHPLHCVRKSLEFRLHQNSTYGLKFVHVQLAMDAHRLGPKFGIPLEAFKHSEVEANKLHGTITLISSEARIVSDEFLVRNQMWILLPKNRKSEFYKDTLQPRLCEHVCSSGVQLRVYMSSQFTSTSCTFCKVTEQCAQCYMDYQIEATDFGERGAAAIFTRWINLGPGKTPYCVQWRSHLYHHKPVLQADRFEEDTIRMRFERQEGVSLDGLTVRNAVKLLSLPKDLLSTIDPTPGGPSNALPSLSPKEILNARGSDGTEWECPNPSAWWWYEVSPKTSIDLASDVPGSPTGLARDIPDGPRSWTTCLSDLIPNVFPLNLLRISPPSPPSEDATDSHGR